jgi:hypothetical protein
VPPTEKMLGIVRLEAGALAAHVVHVLVANGQVIVLREFLLNVVHDSPLGSKAPELRSGCAYAPLALV